MAGYNFREFIGADYCDEINKTKSSLYLESYDGRYKV